jgi:3-oxoacyl-[acyl-carrier protein] reductase
MLCRQLAQEWAADRIRVNAVCPGMIRTPLTEAVYQDEEVAAQREALVPLARIGRGEDVAAAVAYLASAGASYVTGQQLVVDGGVADRMLALIPGRALKPAA